jgi:hypothetical protein
MPLWWIKRNSGSAVALDSLSISETYSSVLIGRPSPEDNDQIISGIRTSLHRLWNGCPVYVVQPTSYTHGKLPAFVFSGEFISYQPARNEEYDASRLVIVWFQDQLTPLCPDAITEQIARIPWEELAADFNW